MFKNFLLLIFVSILFSCNNENNSVKNNSENNTNTSQYYGEKITSENAHPIDSLKAMMGDKTELACKLIGKVDAVCQKKGCWMELKNNDETTMRVTFKDYEFFVPKECSGKTAIVDGVAKIEVTSIADLQEYAKDDGKNKEEIAAITEPLKELVFEAKGVILQ